MLMPGRHWNADKYRFGFQGQEKDDEIKGVGNSINYKFRMHDPRIGRFFAIDPLTQEYPWNSPYAFSENIVINAIEFEGLEGVFTSPSACQSHYQLNKESGIDDELAIGGELIIGATPIGWTLDVKDFYVAYKEGDTWGMVTSLIGFVPFGDLIKNGRKVIKAVPKPKVAVKSSTKIAEKAKQTSNIINQKTITSKANDYKQTRKYWNMETTFQGKKVYQRDDLIDPNLLDAKNRSNLERMQEGLAPIGPDGESIELHHLLQSDDAAIGEVTKTFHQQNKSTIHINTNDIPSGIDRDAFDDFREDYWKNRALDFMD